MSKIDLANDPAFIAAVATAVEQALAARQAAAAEAAANDVWTPSPVSTAPSAGGFRNSETVIGSQWRRGKALEPPQPRRGRLEILDAEDGASYGNLPVSRPYRLPAARRLTVIDEGCGMVNSRLPRGRQATVTEVRVLGSICPPAKQLG